MCLLIVQFFFCVLHSLGSWRSLRDSELNTSNVCLAVDTVMQKTSFQIRVNHYKGFPLHCRTKEGSGGAELQLISTSKFKTQFCRPSDFKHFTSYALIIFR